MLVYFAGNLWIEFGFVILLVVWVVCRGRCLFWLGWYLMLGVFVLGSILFVGV